MSKDIKEAKRDKDLSNKMGWFALGVCVDYFIFKPARSLRTPLFFATGFVCGMVFEFGLENVVTYVRGLFA